MKRLSLLGLVLLLAVGLATTLASDEDSVTGETVTVDVQHGTVTVQVEPASDEETDPVTFVVNADTKILRDGEPIDLADLAPGTRVAVNFRVMEDANIALAIGVIDRA